MTAKYLALGLGTEILKNMSGRMINMNKMWGLVTRNVLTFAQCTLVIHGVNIRGNLVRGNRRMLHCYLCTFLNLKLLQK